MKKTALWASAVLAFSALYTLPQAYAAEGVVNVAVGAEPTNMDPAKYAQGVDMYYIGQMFEQLLRPAPDGKSRINWLAESYEVDENNGKPIISVKLRPGVKFQNGDPLTSADFEFSFQRLRDKNQSLWSHLQGNVEKFEIVDDLNFKLYFKQPDVTYIINNLELWAMPKKYIEEVGIEKFAQAPIGTGPWKLVSRTPKEGATFEAFEDYWNKDARPDAKTLNIKILPEDMSRVAAFQTGEVDWIDAVPLAMIEDVKAMENVKTATFPTGNNLYFDMASDVKGSPFQDQRVRQAVANAADIDSIIQTVLFGQGKRYTQVAEGEPGYDGTLQPYAYDPEKSKALLAEAGYPNGFDTNCYNLTSPREPNVKEMGEAFFAYLSQVGIRCNVIGLEYSAWIPVVRRSATEQKMDGIVSMMYAHFLPADPGFAWTGHLRSFNPDNGIGFHSRANDKEVDDLIDAQRRELDPEKRNTILAKIAKLKHERVLGGVPTYQPLVTMAWRSDKIDWIGWPTPGFWRNFQQVSVKK